MFATEVWVRLDLRNPLHRLVLKTLGGEGEESGGAAELSHGSLPTPPPVEAAPSLAQLAAGQHPAPVALSGQARKQQRLRAKVLATKVGQNFLLPVIRAMTPGEWYTLAEMAALRAGYSNRQAHSSLSVAGKIEQRFGEIFERQKPADGGPLKFRITEEMKSLLA
jgi:hypothetical protein